MNACRCDSGATLKYVHVCNRKLWRALYVYTFHKVMGFHLHQNTGGIDNDSTQSSK